MRSIFIGALLSAFVIVLFQFCLVRQHLTGKVTFKKNGEPVEGARVTFLEHNNGNSGTVLGSGTTDASGNYRIEFKRGMGDEWVVHAGKDSLGGKVSIPRKQKKVDISIE